MAREERRERERARGGVEKVGGGFVEGQAAASPAALTTYPPLSAPSSPWMVPRPVPPSTWCSAVPRPTLHHEKTQDLTDHAAQTRRADRDPFRLPRL